MPTIAKFWIHNPQVQDGEVEIPDGWRRVWRGYAKVGDRYLDRLAWQQRDELFTDPNTLWVTITEELVQEWLERAKQPFPYYESIVGKARSRRLSEILEFDADTFLVLIRKDSNTPPDHGCERCQMNPEILGQRFCEFCRYDIIKELRNRER